MEGGIEHEQGDPCSALREVTRGRVSANGKRGHVGTGDIDCISAMAECDGWRDSAADLREDALAAVRPVARALSLIRHQPCANLAEETLDD